MTKDNNDKWTSRQDAVPIPKLLPISQKKNPINTNKTGETTQKQPNPKTNK